MSVTARISPLGAEASEARRSIFRHSPRDGWLVGLAMLQAALLGFGLLRVALLGKWGALAFAASFGLAICWSSNTVSHNHLHQPLFRTKAWNVVLSWFLTLSMGVPQSLWRARHFWHHAGEPAEARPRFVNRKVAAEAAAILALWGALFAYSPTGLLFAYLPGYALGLLLCRLQGEMEHRRTRSATRGVSYYGRLYNLLWFNDGYHAEHHRFPSEHWTRLPARSAACDAPQSAWPPLLRWLERERPASAGLAAPGRLQAGLLGLLERLALCSKPLQHFMLWSHERAFRRVLSPRSCDSCRIAIIGGGLFPRTALVLGRVLPGAELTIIDHDQHNLSIARAFLEQRGLVGGPVRFAHAAFSPELVDTYDLVVAPLAFVGERSLLCRRRPGQKLLVHEWLWQRSSRRSTVISWLLLKRLSLVSECREAE
jgi:hypothetical protein